MRETELEKLETIQFAKNVSFYEPAEVLYARKREAASRQLELLMWLIVAGCFVSPAVFDILIGQVPIKLAVSLRYQQLIASLVIFVFPQIFRLIFGALPLESLRRKRAQFQMERLGSSEPAGIDPIRAEIRVLSDTMTTDELAVSTATRLFAYYASSSRSLSQSLYSRAGVYLLVGVAVAFSGLGFFYSQTVQALPAGPMDLSHLFSLAPKFGILFFIELVAFFFLRQYRSAMDEFRYYEAIKRNREETLALIRISVDSGTSFDPIKLLELNSFFSKAGVLKKDESSEIIESRKLEKNELDVLEKVVETISKGKSK